MESKTNLHICPNCQYGFSLKSNLTRHLKNQYCTKSKSSDQNQTEKSPDTTAIEGFLQLYTKMQTDLLDLNKKQLKEKEKLIKAKDLEIQQLRYTLSNKSSNKQISTSHIRFLNENISKMIDLETFIENIRNKYQLDYNQTNSLVKSYQTKGLFSYANSLLEILKDNCHQQLTDLNINLPRGLLPIVATDSNLRSLKIKSTNEWYQITGDNQLIKLLEIVNDQINKFHKLKIKLTGDEITKVLNRLKKENSIYLVKNLLGQS